MIAAAFFVYIMHEFEVSTTPQSERTFHSVQNRRTDFVIEEIFWEVERECEQGKQFPPEINCGVTAASGCVSGRCASNSHEASMSTWRIAAHSLVAEDGLPEPRAIRAGRPDVRASHDAVLSAITRGGV